MKNNINDQNYTREERGDLNRSLQVQLKQKTTAAARSTLKFNTFNTFFACRLIGLNQSHPTTELNYTAWLGGGDSLASLNLLVALPCSQGLDVNVIFHFH